TYFESTDYILENKIPELLIQFNKTLAKGFDGHHYIAGLASHFRDLLVSKNPSTIELLEVGEDTKTKYLEQAQKASQDFLIKGINLANDCDLKYKGSKNQRLLVELTLMQLASITFDGEKKNNSRFIIPPSYFKKIGITPIKVSKPENEVETIKKEEQEPIKVNPELQKFVEPPKPKIVLEKGIASDKKRTSGLSLKSIRAKKEHQIKQLDVVIDEENLPKEPFNQDQLTEVWNQFVNSIEKEGKYNLASILSIDKPTLADDGHSIKLTFPNATNKVEVERQSFDLMSYLRKNLNNYDITLDITIDEELDTKYAYTPIEKYEKLKEKNPNLELLRKAFDLDV
ncbi:MAG: DNA polymerase III subunit gamma/tau, partial [Olleya sp.]